MASKHYPNVSREKKQEWYKPLHEKFPFYNKVVRYTRHNCVTLDTRVTTTMDKNNEKNDKFYRKVAFLMYTEMVNFRPQS